jgi:transcriptional regulator
MYDYPHYKEHDKEKIVAFMREHPFISLAGCIKDRVELTQVPVLVEKREGKIFLYGHIARRSDHHKAFETNPNALALFTGPHSYVSGEWYTGSPQTASTWNYISIHARGEIKFMDDEGLIQLLKKLSLHFENGNVSSTTIYDNLPQEYVDRMRKAIVAFELEVTELENVHKLSQNRDEKSYDNIVQQLKKQEGDGKLIGELMEKRKAEVFSK